MDKKNTFEEFQKDQLKDPKFREEYEALAPEFEKLQAALEADDKTK